MDLYRLIAPALDVLGRAPSGLQVLEAGTLIRCHYPNVNVDLPALIGPIQDRAQCEALCVRLGQAYPEHHQVFLLKGVEGGAATTDVLFLEQLGDTEITLRPVLLYVPPLSCAGSVGAFQDTVAHLRAPDGCPWDRQQTHRSLRQGFQEEAYEVLDALDRGDLEALKEELGDVLLHVLLQVQIATELGEFRLSDIISYVNTKIVHRHPHVFGGLDVAGVEEVLVNWEMLKQQEKQAQTENPSALDGIAPAMPALARAQSIQRHVDRTGVVSVEIDDLSGRVMERVTRLSSETDSAARSHLLGDLLFDLTNLARHVDVDAESALREANARFERQFRALERESA